MAQSVIEAWEAYKRKLEMSGKGTETFEDMNRLVNSRVKCVQGKCPLRRNGEENLAISFFCYATYTAEFIVGFCERYKKLAGAHRR